MRTFQDKDMVLTGDGSQTFYNAEYREFYHSISGAIEERREKFVKPTLPCIAGKKEIKIFDICFGIGYNSLCFLREMEKGKVVRIRAFEKDPDILKQMKLVHVMEPYQKVYHKLQGLILKNLRDKKPGNETILGNEITLKLYLGDVRNEILNYIGNDIDIVLHDPFSPKKLPELWTIEFFKSVSDRMRKGGILTTYSCASIIRKNLREAGFLVKDGPVVGRKAPSTIAIKE